MLRPLNDRKMKKPPFLPLSEADAREFFPRGLEYNPPARGVWNIVHMGLLIPEGHQIYVCAQGCLRGVTLTVAETGDMDRLSWVSLSEEDMFDGTLESDVTDGVSEVIEKLPYRPRAVLIFLSCMHLFAGADYEVILADLRDRYPDIDFVDCYMTPTMRETFSPVVWLTKRMYSLVKPLSQEPRSVSIIGCDRPLDEESELIRIIKQNGFTLRDLTRCTSYDEFMQLGESFLDITCLPTAVQGARELAERTGARHLHLRRSFLPENIRAMLGELCDALGVPLPDLDENERRAEEALAHAAALLGGTPVAIDYTAVTRPFELALLLSRRGFNVQHIICDALGEDGEAFEQLKKERPHITLWSSANPNMATFADEPHDATLAIGQKAAWFFATDNFVDIIQNGDLSGFVGLRKLAALIEDAHRTPKDRRTVIQHKGWHCFFDPRERRQAASQLCDVPDSPRDTVGVRGSGGGFIMLSA